MFPKPSSGVFCCPHLSTFSLGPCKHSHTWLVHIREAQLTSCTAQNTHGSWICHYSCPDKAEPRLLRGHPFSLWPSSADAYLSGNLLNPLVMWSFLSSPQAKPESGCSQGPSAACLPACPYCPTPPQICAAFSQSALNGSFSWDSAGILFASILNPLMHFSRAFGRLLFHPAFCSFCFQPLATMSQLWQLSCNLGQVIWSL